MEQICHVSELPNEVLYQDYFANNQFDKQYLENHCIYKTWWKGKGGAKYSDSSCSFVDTKDKTKEELRKDSIKTLRDIFGLEAGFEKRFDESTKNNILELRRINTLHSSSLIALLCFYKIRKEKDLSFTHDGIEFVLNECSFESKNKVGNGYSNIDIKLGGTANGEPAVLFLESKFSEYLTPGNYTDKSLRDEVYGELYRKLKDKQPLDVNFKKCVNEGRYYWTVLGKNHYCEGVKQMISHYLGINNHYMEGQKNKGSKVYLGEILFDFNPYIQDERLSDYSILYHQLSKKLNNLPNKNQDFEVLPNIMTYQDIFKDFKLDDSVQKFYGIGKK